MLPPAAVQLQLSQVIRATSPRFMLFRHFNNSKHQIFTTVTSLIWVTEPNCLTAELSERLENKSFLEKEKVVPAASFLPL